MLPQKLKVQVVHILRDAFGNRNAYQSDTDVIWEALHKGLAREYGLFTLGTKVKQSNADALVDHFLTTPSVDEALDFIERAFLVVDNFCRGKDFIFHSEPAVKPDDAIAELNTRFRESSIGYEFVEGMIVRKDSELIHAETIVPALHLLTDSRFKGADEEYRAAHQHYREGRFKEALNDCLKSFESTMKSICVINNWAYTDRDTAKGLIDIMFEKELIPQFLQSEFSGLRTILISGVPTARNRLGGHGQGQDVVAVPSYFASYVLALTASSIKFLIEALNA